MSLIDVTIEYPTIADAAASDYPPPVGTTFRTAGGVSATDCGGAQWKVVASEPSHPGKIELQAELWGEILGPILPVEAFGAFGDCPDVSGYNLATRQAAIAAAVGAATNDIQAFQDAFKAAKAIGGAIVTFGHGKRYRIAFDHLGIFALVVGDNTTLQRVGGGWLEFDPSLLTGEHPSYSGLPAKRNWPDPGLCAGDPDTGLEQSVALLAGTSNVVSASEGIDETDFTYNVHMVDVDIRCHTRTYWHALADAPLPSYRRLRMYGIKLRSVIGASVKGCFVKRMPNDGYYITGRDVDVDGCIGEANGYGSVIGTACNNFSLIGLQYLGRAEISAEAFTFTNCTSRYARDEGFAKGGIKSLFVTNFTSIGDHDRAVEGITGYVNSLSSGTMGEPIDGDVTVDGVLQDGKHQCVTATTSAGSTIVAVSDAFWLGVDAPGTAVLERFLFIPGAGAEGSAGPFRITAVDYVANTITVADDVDLPKPANSVVDAAAYTYSRGGVTMGDANETRVTLRNLKMRNLYCTVHAVWANATSGGRFLVDDAELENAYVPANFNGCSLEGEYVTVRNVRAIGCLSAGNCGFIRTNATTALVESCQADAGFAFAARAAEFNGTANSLIVRDCVVGGTQLSAIKLDFALKCSLVEINGNRFRGVNSAASDTEGVIFIANPTLFTADEFNIEDNFVRFAGRLSTYPLTASGDNIPAGAFTRGRIACNDLLDPDYFALGANGNRFYNNYAGSFRNLFVQDNCFPGARCETVTAIPPTTGRWYYGDEIRDDFPLSGSPERARCTVGGNYAALVAADGTSAVMVNGAVIGSNTVLVSDGTNIKPNDTIVFSGAFTRVVWWVDHATNTLTLSAALTASDGDTVENVTPTFMTTTVLYPSGSKTFDPPSVEAQSAGVPGVQSTTLTVTGVALGDFVTASFSLSLGGLRLMAEATAADTVTVYFINTTADPIDLDNGTLRARKL